MVKHGMTPATAIQAATVNAAEPARPRRCRLARAGQARRPDRGRRRPARRRDGAEARAVRDEGRPRVRRGGGLTGHPAATGRRRATGHVRAAAAVFGRVRAQQGADPRRAATLPRPTRRAWCSKSARARASTPCTSRGNLPQLSWQPTDQAEHLAALTARVGVEGPCNLLPPLELDVADSALALRRRLGRRGLQREHAAHHGLAARAGVLPRRRARAASRGPADRLRALPLFGASTPRTATTRSTTRCAAAIPRAASAISSPSTRSRAPRVSRLVDDVAMPANNQTLVWRKAAA